MLSLSLSLTFSFSLALTFFTPSPLFCLLSSYRTCLFAICFFSSSPLCKDRAETRETSLKNKKRAKNVLNPRVACNQCTKAHKKCAKNVSETLSWRANNASKHIKTHQTPTITQKNASKSCRNTQNCADSVFDIFRSTFVQHSRFLFRKSAGRGCFLRKTPFLLASVEIGIFFLLSGGEKGQPEKEGEVLVFRSH